MANQPSLEPSQPPPEFSQAEVHSLLRAAKPKTRALIALLLSGVSGSELLAIRGADLDLEKGILRISGLSKRRLALSEAVRRSLARADFRFSRQGQTILRHQNEEPYSLPELDALIAQAADDAELSQASEAGSELLRQTYLAFLARQGADLTQFQDVIGRVPPSLRTGFVDLMPPGGPRPPQSITIEYPGLDDLA